VAADPSGSVRVTAATVDGERLAPTLPDLSCLERDTEYDHLVPLELGRNPNDPRNRWIEPGASPNPKDGVESRLHELVCEGRVPLAAAQEAIATGLDYGT
jgi:hypothetical protein